VQTNQPAASYQAVLPTVNFNKNSHITGTVTGTSVAGGSGITFNVNIAGLPDLATYGPFSMYTTSSHPLHTNPIPQVHSEEEEEKEEE
jgi:hypothetical protein